MAMIEKKGTRNTVACSFEQHLMSQINEVDIPRWARYWVEPLTPSQVLLRYSDTTVSGFQLLRSTCMCVYTNTHSELMHVSGLSAVSWLTDG